MYEGPWHTVSRGNYYNGTCLFRTDTVPAADHRTYRSNDGRICHDSVALCRSRPHPHSSARRVPHAQYSLPILWCSSGGTSNRESCFP